MPPGRARSDSARDAGPAHAGRFGPVVVLAALALGEDLSRRLDSIADRLVGPGVGSVPIGIPAAGLGEPAADQIRPGHDRGEEPYVVGAERAALGVVDRARDQDREQEREVDPELRGLERVLRLRAETSGVTARTTATRAV